MKAASTTFFCDTSQCKALITVIEEDVTSAYLSLVDKGWKVTRSHFKTWTHTCPEHIEGAAE